VKSISWHDFRQKAASGAKRRIVLADGTDARVIRAAAIAQRDKIAEPILVGPRDQIEPLWLTHSTAPLNCLDIKTMSSTDREKYLRLLLSLPKTKSLTTAEALQRLQDPLSLGCLYLKDGQADGFVGGAARTTADTLRAVFQIVGLAPKTSALFGFFLIERRTATAGECAIVLLADCAVIPEPSPKQLANVAIGAADAYSYLTGEPPRVVFLSFSTAGSAEHETVNRMREARDMAREKAPALAIEGEWQADAALDAFTAGIKGVGTSPLAGRGNVLIVPDLNTGNIAYKLAQRLGGCRAVGPVLWGTDKPANDLSRGCSTEDVVDMLALTVLQTQRARPALEPKNVAGGKTNG
jgi:phosphate acetyltransferase